MTLNEIPRPHRSRLDPQRADYGEIIRRHEEAVRHGDTFYRDPSTGLSVITVVVHLERATCCDSGCRHCPFVDDCSD